MAETWCLLGIAATAEDCCGGVYVGMPPYYLNCVTISVQIDLGKDGQPGSDLRGA